MLDQKYLKECLSYDPESGVFTWKERPLKHFKNSHDCNSWNTNFSSKVAGYFCKGNYMQITVKHKAYYSHRLAWYYVYGVWPENDIDHINHDTSDNRISNLREATEFENLQNQIKPRIDNKSGYLGVCYCKCAKKFRAKIQVNNKRHHLGYFKSPEEAYAAYLKGKKELHPFSTI